MTKQVRDYFDIAMREKERADASEAREKKLRDAIELAMIFYGMGESSQVKTLLEGVLASLYPEEETK